uniref:Uncharacterized protein n=1 Tax=Anguilla anguilla TaxID=7936 RepID=A0A0E9PU49_ANGAN
MSHLFKTLSYLALWVKSKGYLALIENSILWRVVLLL